MKPSHRHSTQEKKAHRLWRQFDRKNQESFWQKYEVLIRQSKNSIQVAPLQYPSSPIPNSIGVKSEVFSPSRNTYIRTVLSILLFTSLFIFIDTQTSFIKDSIDYGKPMAIIFLILLIVSCTIPIIFAIWQLDTFYLKQDHLLIKNAFGKKNVYDWADIQYMFIEKRMEEYSSYVVLIVETYSNKKHTFNFNFSAEVREVFFLNVASRNINISNHT